MAEGILANLPIEQDDQDPVVSELVAASGSVSGEPLPEDGDASVLEDVSTAADEATDERRKWYVVHCYSGYENKVKRNLEQRISSKDMEGFIFQFVVPKEE